MSPLQMNPTDEKIGEWEDFGDLNIVEIMMLMEESGLFSDLPNLKEGLGALADQLKQAGFPGDMVGGAISQIEKYLEPLTKVEDIKMKMAKAFKKEYAKTCMCSADAFAAALGKAETKVAGVYGDRVESAIKGQIAGMATEIAGKKVEIGDFSLLGSTPTVTYDTNDPGIVMVQSMVDNGRRETGGNTVVVVKNDPVVPGNGNPVTPVGNGNGNPITPVGNGNPVTPVGNGNPIIPVGNGNGNPIVPVGNGNGNPIVPTGTGPRIIVIDPGTNPDTGNHGTPPDGGFQPEDLTVDIKNMFPPAVDCSKGCIGQGEKPTKKQIKRWEKDIDDQIIIKKNEKLIEDAKDDVINYWKDNSLPEIAKDAVDVGKVVILGACVGTGNAPCVAAWGMLDQGSGYLEGVGEGLGEGLVVYGDTGDGKKAFEVGGEKALANTAENLIKDLVTGGLPGLGKVMTPAVKAEIKALIKKSGKVPLSADDIKSALIGAGMKAADAAGATKKIKQVVSATLKQVKPGQSSSTGGGVIQTSGGSPEHSGAGAFINSSGGVTQR